ncbi:MAG: CaiB/BaiF CoA transferase family protein [Acidimicrobiia bacterium]
MTDGLLARARVVEFGNLIAAPYAGMLLADLGAEVVKVEPPSGDLGRHFGPYQGGESWFFLSVNRGKRSVVLDLKQPAAHRWAVELCRRADVVLHNQRRGVMERLGLGWEDLQAVNPRLVYAVVAAFAADGPEADRVGIDVIFQGESGMISITGHPADPPQKTATTIGDYLAGTNTALGICAALVERAATGRGRRVDVSLRDGLVAVQSGWNALYFATGEQPRRTGTASPFLAPNQVLPTADGHLTLGIVSDSHFVLLCRTIGIPDLAEELPTNEVRMARREELAARLEAVFRRDTTEAWVGRLQDAGLPVGRVLTLPEVLADGRRVVEYDHPVAGRVRATGSPLRVDGAQLVAASPPPTLGGDTVEVLKGLGATDQEIEALRGAMA